MTPSDDNPFDVLGLDPSLRPEDITRILRRRVETAPTDEREEIARQWRILTMNDENRVRYALFAHPRSRPLDSESIESLRDAVPPIVLRFRPPETQISATAPTPPRLRRPVF